MNSKKGETMPHVEAPGPCPECRVHSGVDADIKTVKASLACIKESLRRDNINFWKTIHAHHKETGDEMKTKVSLKIFIAAFAFIVTVAIAVTGFQWSAIAKGETLDRTYQEKMNDKMQKMQQDISVIKAMTIEKNGD